MPHEPTRSRPAELEPRVRADFKKRTRAPSDCVAFREGRPESGLRTFTGHLTRRPAAVIGVGEGGGKGRGVGVRRRPNNRRRTAECRCGKCEILARARKFNGVEHIVTGTYNNGVVYGLRPHNLLYPPLVFRPPTDRITDLFCDS